jgi:hypothetical protein
VPASSSMFCIGKLCMITWPSSWHRAEPHAVGRLRPVEQDQVRHARHAEVHPADGRAAEVGVRDQDAGIFDQAGQVFDRSVRAC